MYVHTGIEIGSPKFTDLVYADDTALFLLENQDHTTVLFSFTQTTCLMGRSKIIQSWYWYVTLSYLLTTWLSHADL